MRTIVVSKLMLYGREHKMDFDRIEDIKKYIEYLESNCKRNSKWHKDLKWFESNNYTTTSEYFGELLLFVQQLLQDKEMREQRDGLLQLEKTLKSYFN